MTQELLKKLETAIANNHKQAYIDTIFDFTDNDILSLTEDEINIIFTSSQKIIVGNIGEFFDYITNEGEFYLNSALNGINELNNALLCRFYFGLYINLFQVKNEKYASALINQGIVYSLLSNLGVNSLSNLENAIELNKTARVIFAPDTPDHASAMMNEATARQRLAEIGVESKTNLESAIELHKTAREIFAPDTPDHAGAMMNEASARQILAEIGVESKTNLESAIELCKKARDIFAPNIPDHASAMMNEATARQRLAEIGVESKINLENAIELNKTARVIFAPDTPSHASAMMNEATARQRLAEIGVESKTNLESAIELYKAARDIFAPNTPDHASTMLNESNTRQILAEIGVESKTNLESAIELCKKARDIFAPDTPDHASAMLNEANARQRLAEIGVESKINLENAIELYKAARETFAPDTPSHALTMMNEATARQSLAEVGVESKTNLESAIKLHKAARVIFAPDTPNHASAMLNEATARQILAEIGVESKTNLENAIELYKAARDIFAPDTPDHALAMMNEASAWQRLAVIGVKSKTNLESAIELYKTARDIFAPNTPDHARAIMNEATARQRLAEIGVESKTNLESAIKLHKTAREIFAPDTPSHAFAMMNEATARQRLAEIGVESKENLESAKTLYEESLFRFDSLKNCVAYSIVLLNLNIFLISNFRKSGKRAYIEDAKTILEDAEKKIKTREVRNKNTILAKLHESRAILLEFEGRSGIDMAAREYAEAYNLTEEPFYQFMDEFCRSRIGIEPETKPFCMLVSRWNEVEKDGIFLDYYDYSVFECHIENAVDSTGLSREEEFRAALKKLQEIRDRTQVKIIKDRVSAYVYLMQAVVDCFRHDTYEEAKGKVRAACKIFNEYDDKDGKKTCDKFYDALIENKSEDAWMELIRNKDGISCPFYRLLKEGADKKRVKIAEMKLGKLYKTVDRIETKVDDISTKISKLQNELSSGFDRIKEKIERGFEDEKEQHQVIIGRLDSTQQKLDTLLTMSKDIEGEEGENIRKFSKQILELVENEDSDALKQFIENIIGSESSFISSIEQSANPEKHKDEAKEELETTLSGFKGISAKVKKEAGKFGRNVTYNVAAALMAEEIIKYIFPLITTATVGIPIPIPSQLLNSLSKAVKR